MQILRFILLILGSSGAWTLYQLTQTTLPEAINSGNYGSLVAFAVGAIVVGLCFWGASVLGTHHEANDENAASEIVLSESEISNTRVVYSRMSTDRLKELLESSADLRPGAVKLVREELNKRSAEDQSTVN